MNTLSRWCALLLLLTGNCANANSSTWAINHGLQWELTPDITYLVADNHESKLDVLGPRDKTKKTPVLLYIHGGGWVVGDRHRVWPQLLPYSDMGLAIVNISYRLARVALAPAAVEDARCALRWLHANADKYGLDAERVVVAGNSAGGHLSLTTGMLRTADGLDDRCPGAPVPGTRTDVTPREMPVAAIVNWYGITDVADLVSGNNAKTYAVGWLGGQPDWRAIAERVSPVRMVHREQPPVLTIHGNEDGIVPYAHATALHKRLDRAGVSNALHTVDGGGHGRFSAQQYETIFTRIRRFLIEHGVLTGADGGFR